MVGRRHPSARGISDSRANSVADRLLHSLFAAHHSQFTDLHPHTRPSPAWKPTGKERPASTSTRPRWYFHKYPIPGKLEIQATKPLGNQRDLALAYSPGVAAPCLAIRDDPALAADYTARANLVARDLQRVRRARPRQYRPAGVEARDGRQGGPVQEIRRHRRLRHRDRRARHRAHGRARSRRSSRPSAGSISKTSRRRSASRSRSG